VEIQWTRSRAPHPDNSSAGTPCCVGLLWEPVNQHQSTNTTAWDQREWVCVCVWV